MDGRICAFAFARHPGIAKRYPGSSDFVLDFQRHWIPAFAGMTKKGVTLPCQAFPNMPHDPF
ncbi:MAG: hypothetical protein OJF61_000839 [Rhodanobacteraceae bacterium]|jgi:hypothetical protein|nr:MAG: hypothetical protein OJF61_000839 [Rhodanobacteraceae bacterium]